jgi:hypothetical protein
VGQVGPVQAPSIIRDSVVMLVLFVGQGPTAEWEVIITLQVMVSVIKRPDLAAIGLLGQLSGQA